MSNNQHKPPPPTKPRPPSGPPPSQRVPPPLPSGPPPSQRVPPPLPSGPPLTIRQTHQVRVNNELLNRLDRLGSRPDIESDDKKRPRDPEFSNVSYATGKRATWAVPDFENRQYGQPGYHDDEICGSGNDGLAHTINKKLNKGQLVGAIEQIKRCIRGRTVTAVDSTHKNTIPLLIEFLEQLEIYMGPNGPKEEYHDVLRNGRFVVQYEHYTHIPGFKVYQYRNMTAIDKNLEEVLKKSSRNSGGSRKYKKTRKSMKAKSTKKRNKKCKRTKRRG